MDWYEFQFSFFSRDAHLKSSVRASDKEDVQKLFEELSILFATVEDGEKTIQALQQNTTPTRKGIENLANKYSPFWPKLNALPAYFAKLKEGEYFYYLPNIKLT